MKNWRRTSRIGRTTAAVPGPVLLDVATDGSDTVVAHFSLAVTLGVPGACSLVIDGQAGGWVSQVDPTHLAWIDIGGVPHNPGEAWSLPGPEPQLTPAVTLGSVGITT